METSQTFPNYEQWLFTAFHGAFCHSFTGGAVCGAAHGAAEALASEVVLGWWVIMVISVIQSSRVIIFGMLCSYILLFYYHYDYIIKMVVKLVDHLDHFYILLSNWCHELLG